jgi:Zn-dependent protease with chaperone function
MAAIALAACLGAQAVGVPALAMSTATEIAQGRAEAADVDAHSIIINDPFLTSWVNRVGAQLAQERRRRDVTYTFTILADPDINAFALKGGFIHVDLGLLNFVGSDDELAATLGHEMGHVELRHVVNGSNAGTIVDILTMIASVLSPAVGLLGQIGGELAGQKYSRAQELQADHYGLQLMTEAGYDPEAAVDVMSKLGQMEPGPNSRADKAFLDHPVPQDRVAHLLGYPELNKPPVTALIAQAIHDQDEGRYSYADAKLRAVAAHDPNPLVAEHMTQLNYALRESGALAAPDGRVMRTVVGVDDPRRVRAVQELRALQTAARSASDQAKDAARLGLGDLDALEHQLASSADALGNLPQGPAGPQTVNAAGGVRSVAHLEALIEGTMAAADDVLTTAPGLLGPNEDTIRDMVEPLTEDAPLTPKYAALLEFYPAMIRGLDESTHRLVDSIAQSRAAIAQAQFAAQTLANVGPGASSAPSVGPRPAGSPPPPRNLGPALSAWEDAFGLARHAQDEMYAAQAADLSAEITLLDVQSSPDRYAAFAKALAYRFPGITPPDFAQAQRLGVAPGEIACAAWYAFDTHDDIDAVLTHLASSGTSCEDEALTRHLLGESMEIAEGLVYEDYVDTPQPIKPS